MTSSSPAVSGTAASAVPTLTEPLTEQAYGVVLGCPRSGTTYLSRLLKTIPEFECMIGTLLPVVVPHVVNQPISDAVYRALAVGFERSLDAYLHSGRYHSRAAAIQKWFNAPTGLGDLLRALQGKRTQPECMIYKEPTLAFAPEFVMDAFPQGKILHIYRDGRDCAHSNVQSYDALSDHSLSGPHSAVAHLSVQRGSCSVPWWVEDERADEFAKSSSYVRSIWMWKYMVRRCHEAFSHVDKEASGRVMQLCYEDLVRNPMEHGRAVVDFFGGRPSRAFDKLLSEAHTSSIGKHKQRDPAEVAEAERIAHEELVLFGYLN